MLGILFNQILHFIIKGIEKNDRKSKQGRNGKDVEKSKRIAVVGLSDNPERTSYMVSKAMQDSGYEIIPVNPAVSEVLGVKAVKALKDIEGHVDIVNVFRRSEFLPEIAKEFAEIDADIFGRS